MFFRQVSVELRKTLKHPALWIGLAALLLLLAFYMAVHFSQIKYGFVEPVGGVQQDLLATLSIFNWIGGFIYAVTASVVTAFDYPDLRLYLSRGLPRPVLLLARLTVILLITIVLVSFSMYASLGLAAVLRIAFFGAADLSQLNMAAVLPAVLRTFWSSLPYLGLTVLIAVISRSPIVAAGGMIVYADVFEKYLLSLGARYPLLTRFLPGQLSLILQARNFTLDRAAADLAIPPDLMAEPEAILVIAIFFGILCALSFTIFSRQDLGG